jgi:DNA-binding NarL/FixJ family response regulator
MTTTPTSTLRLVVADDHTLFRELLSLHLQSVGHDVVAQATDGEHAVRLFRQHQPDLVLMDVAMPGLDGIGATREILRIDRRQRVLMVSMHADAVTVRYALGAGARGFVSKDCVVDELLGAVDTVMGGDIALSSDVEATLGDRAEANVFEPLLTDREQEVLSLLAQGVTTTDIAARLFISQKTVKNHLAAIYDKLDVTDRTQAVVRAARLGIVRLERD